MTNLTLKLNCVFVFVYFQMSVCINTGVAVEEDSAYQRWMHRAGSRMMKRRKKRKGSTEYWLFAVIHVPSAYMSHGH